MLLVCFPPPDNENDVTRITLRRGTSLGNFPETIFSERSAKDGYGNWVTFYEDEDPSLVEGQPYFYKIEYLKPNDITNTSFSIDQEIQDIKGLLSYELRVSTVYEQLQGLGAARFMGCTVYRMIGAFLAEAERVTRMKLQPTQVVGEVYGAETFRKILGNQIGYQIGLRHFPVRSIERIRYQVRAGQEGSVKEFEDLDILLTNDDQSRNYNRGTVTIWPRQASVAALFAGLVLGTGIHSPTVNVLIDYTHGYTNWPADLAFHISNAVSGFAMEIMGEAITAGLSMRGVDGYTETYTASATTTIFSARRGLYLDEYKKALKGYRKPIWSFG